MGQPPSQPGLLVMAYGTPRSIDEVEAYYTHIRRGRPPTPEEVAELVSRYEAIGGSSPLAERTEAQRLGLEAALASLAEDGGERWPVALGNKHAAPLVEDGVDELAASGATDLVGLVLAPHWSAASVGEYHRRAGARANELGLTYSAIPSWHLLSPWVELLAESVREQLRAMPARTRVLFSAHSLPERMLAEDPYPDQLAASAAAIAAAAGLDAESWGLAWQSAGRTPEPWRGPDINEVIRGIATDGTADGVLVCPQGFVADHLEVLYDLDVMAAATAAECGLSFARTAVMNDDPACLAALAELVLHTDASREGPKA